METEYWGRYRVHLTRRHVGWAGGEVFFGYDPLLCREIAIKKMCDITSAKREARIMSKVGPHENIVQVYDFITFGANAYIIMELVSETPLGEYFDAGRKWDQQRAVRITIEVLKGLMRIHTCGYIHTDIVPTNVLIVDQEPLSAKIIDFGCAVRKGPDGTWRGKPKGIPVEYMPPEQFEHNALLDESSDLYMAAGLCTYLLSGIPPFAPDWRCQYNGKNVAEFGRYRRQCYGLHLHRDFHDVGSGELSGVLQRALHPHRTERYRSAEQLIEALLPFTHEDPWREQSKARHGATLAT